MIKRGLKKMVGGIGNKGFSLIEMLIAMAIFVIFTGVIMNSYISVVRAMRGAEEYRILYSDARHVFDVLTENAREKTIYNPNASLYLRAGDLQASNTSVTFYSYDGSEEVTFKWVEDSVVGEAGTSNADAADVSVDTVAGLPAESSGKIVMTEKDGISGVEVVKSLHSDAVKVKSFKVYVWPLKSPFSGSIFHPNGDVDYSLLFHPRVTFSAVFEKENSTGGVYTLPLQTSVSLRNYN